ncbi:hypothetical protein [Thermoanaerobacterium thermosaccharolyticum]|uniref:Pilus assembly protein TadE n=1 Tax=Thermoanaerobacterium thermosaccharolyticum (strain ATCC 7956 / DSM 571 / NCIMB 9385 / NCA 3814 / NCTC 13789 / WDCM 00135 / 2032) TaxID=580327 RepID=D9TQ73_THETC|nr:hypothetical protein [Thermoanaerobacterium thermosaccharolyticum]ADL67860.1 conserved hypothetical protein [Thermoanaerobacterium thermosaccharolyticum DSM 571]TCW42574.1 hypothetical protein EDC21_101190 [Thermohydrogenium kirishiense]
MELFAFVLVLPFLIVPIANTVNMLVDLTRYDMLRQAAREAVLRMEIEGGMTDDELYNIDAFLKSKGIDTNKVHIDYTPYPVPYGEDVKVKISMDTVMRRYTITLGGIKRIDESTQFVYGPISSVSKKYER